MNYRHMGGRTRADFDQDMQRFIFIVRVMFMQTHVVVALALALSALVTVCCQFVNSRFPPPN
jgi:hypothetical protein